MGGENPAYTASYTNNRRNGFGYDAAGNLTNDGGQTFTYDATGQQATASYLSMQQYYDGNGLRVKKTENGTATWYLRSSVLGGQVIAEMNASGTWTRGYVYAGSGLLAVQSGGAVNWMHEDPVTKSKRVTDASGTVVSTVELDPWGGDTNRSSNGAFQPKKFTSYERDANGSDEAMFRRYNRWHSRFDQPDPYDGSYSLTDPQSFNRYGYTQNDPVNFVDPTGTVCDVIWQGAIYYLALCGGSDGPGGSGPIQFHEPRDGGGGGHETGHTGPQNPAQPQAGTGGHTQTSDCAHIRANLLGDPRNRSALNDAWTRSQFGTNSAHEEGGLLGQVIDEGQPYQKDIVINQTYTTPSTSPQFRFKGSLTGLRGK